VERYIRSVIQQRAVVNYYSATGDGTVIATCLHEYDHTEDNTVLFRLYVGT